MRLEIFCQFRGSGQDTLNCSYTASYQEHPEEGAKTGGIAIGSWAYIMGYYNDDPIPLDTVIQKLGELGYDGIELCGHRPHAHPLDYPTNHERSDLLSMISGCGLGISGYLPDLQGLPILTSSYESITRKYLRVFEANLEFCADLDIKAIRVDEGGSWFRLKAENAPQITMSEVEYKNRWGKLISIWKDCARRANDYGITVLWEFEPTDTFNKPREIIRLIDELALPNFKGLLETMHAHLICSVGALQRPPLDIVKGGLPEFIRLLNDRIGHIHLTDSDNTFQHGIFGNKKMLGEGILDFDEIMQTLKAVGYRSEWWTVDLLFQPVAWDMTKRAGDFAKALLRKYCL